MRIGLLSDTHIPAAGQRLPTQVIQVFDGVDLILHAGDIYTSSVLDELEEVAPVLAVRGNGDLAIKTDQRVKDYHVLTLEGMRLGLVHAIELPWSTRENVFGSVDIAVFGDTHVAIVQVYGATLLINPGSPTFPNNWERQLGTVAILEIQNGRAKARIINLKEQISGLR